MTFVCPALIAYFRRKLYLHDILRLLFYRYINVLDELVGSLLKFVLKFLDFVF